MKMRAWLLYIPPPVITGFAALIMWLSHTFFQMFRLMTPELIASRQATVQQFGGQQWFAIGIALAGLPLMLVAAHTLRRARTTLLPFKPSQTRALVTHGIFSFSRNPIYLGDALLLLAWAVWLGAALNLLWFGLFILYMTNVQIFAEEQALLQKFGAAYQAYCQRVRRWL